jgi:hypothetical protein
MTSMPSLNTELALPSEEPSRTLSSTAIAALLEEVSKVVEVVEEVSLRVKSERAAVGCLDPRSFQVSLGELGRRLDQLIRRYRLEILEPWRRLTASAEYSASDRHSFISVFRLMGALDTVVHLTLRTVDPAVTLVRPATLTDEELPALQVRCIPCDRLPDAACRRLFSEQCVDLLSAVRATVIFTRRGPLQQSRIAAAVRAANDNGLGRWPLPGAGVVDPIMEIEETLADEAYVAQLLYHDSSQLRQEDVRRLTRIVAVKDWNGALRYPKFQFYRDGLQPQVATGLGGLLRAKGGAKDPPFSGWPLAIWLYINTQLKVSGPNFFADALDPIGLWHQSPRADQVALESIEGAQEDHCLPTASLEPGEYYRVSGVNYDSPYYYSRFDGDHPGRYDPAGSPDKGALYFGKDAIGCWAEVLDRQPVVTLGYLATRCLFKLTVSENAGALSPMPEVMDLWLQHSRFLAALRDESQAVAKIAMNGLHGVKYALRAMPGSVGFALFGVSVDGIRPEPQYRDIPGVWTFERIKSWYECEHLWRYLDLARSGRVARFPVILRRLPDDPRPDPVHVGLASSGAAAGIV